MWDRCAVYPPLIWFYPQLREDNAELYDGSASICGTEREIRRSAWSVVHAAWGFPFRLIGREYTLKDGMSYV